MATYTITDPQTGDIVRISGIAPPSDEEIDLIFDVRRSKKIGEQGDYRNPQKGVTPGAIPKQEGASGGFGEAVGRAALQTIPSVNDVVEMLPAAGGAVGGVLGGAGGAIGGVGVGAVPGAMIGGASGAATGESLRQLIQRARGRTDLAPATMGEAAGDIGIQAALGAGGELAGPLVGKAATSLQRGALGASDAVFNQFPNMARRALDEGIGVTRAGLSKAKGLVDDLGSKAAGLKSEAERLATKGLPVRGPKGQMQVGPKKPNAELMGKAAATEGSAAEAAALADTINARRNAPKTLGSMSAADVIGALGLGGVGAAAGGAVAGPMGAALGGAATTAAGKVLSNPAVRSKIALAADKAVKMGLPPQLVRAAVLSIMGENETDPAELPQ